MNLRPFLLIALTLLTACQREGWHGSIVQRAGVAFVTNEGTGVDAKTARESLRPLWTVGGTSAGASFARATWIDFDPAAGDVYVLDSDQQKITRLASDGSLLQQFGGRGEAPGQLSKSNRFAFLDGRLYVANNGNGRIEVLGPGGEVFPSVRLEEVPYPSEIYFANGRFVLARPFVPKGSYIYTYDRNFRFERAVRPGEPLLERLDMLRTHNTVCAAPDGLWIVYKLLNRIQKVGYDGRVILETSRDLDWKFPKDEKGRVIPEILVHRACAVDPAGNLYVVFSNPEDWKRGNDVYKFGPDGRLRQFAFTLPIHNISMMRFDRGGDLFFSDGKTLTKAKLERTNG